MVAYIFAGVFGSLLFYCRAGNFFHTQKKSSRGGIYMGKIFRRTFLTLIIAIFALSAAIVGAKIQMYTATGEDYANEVESQDIAKLRARDKAIKKATKQAGVYLKTYSRSVNSELTDDEVTAITSNAWQLVGEPKYSSEIKKLSDETSIIVWKATVEVNVDDSEIQSWIKRDDKDKSTIINQTREAQKVSEENDRQIKDLREKYNRATSQAEKDSLRKQMDAADRDFLANQKLEEGNKFYYAGDYKGAIKFFNEALQLKSDWDWAYNNRGAAYRNLKQYEFALQDYNRAVELNPNNFEAYFNRGLTFYSQKQYDSAIQDYDKAISLNPNYFQAYNNRGYVYLLLGQFERAIKDLDRAIYIRQDLEEAYINRGLVYQCLNKYELAVKDYDKAISLNPNSFEGYNNRGYTFYLLKKYEQGLKDCNKALELNPDSADCYDSRGCIYFGLKKYDNAIADFNRALKLNPNLAETYYNRGMCYQALGDEAKAQADFAKAKELGYDG